MSKIFALPFALLLPAIAAGCARKNSDSMGMNGDATSMSPAATEPSAAKYTCTMHPEVVSNVPGKCPKCGILLVAKH